MTRFAFVLLILVPLVLTPQSVGEGLPNLNKALEAQRQLVNERPYNTEVQNDLGNLLALDGKYQEAESAYGRALELDPSNTSAQFNLGLLLQQDGRPKEALEAFKAVMAADAGHAWATYQAGVVFAERGKRKDALEHYARAFALDSSLTFANTNPHIIDNHLATEALLLSKKYSGQGATRMPRLYGEPDRIVGLMLDEEEAEDKGGEEDEDDGEGEEDNKRSTKVEHQTRNLHPRAVEDGGEAAGQVGGSKPRAAHDDEDDPPARRGAVQVVGGSLGGTAASANQGRQGKGREARTGRRTGGQPGRTATVGRGANQGGANQGREDTVRSQSPNRSRYRPATTSSGRLEMELLPEEDPERVTR